jgi:hypothetical protein
MAVDRGLTIGPPGRQVPAGRLASTGAGGEARSPPGGAGSMSFDSPAFLVLLVVSMVIVRLPVRGVAWGLLAISALFYAFAGAFDFTLFAAILIGNGLAAAFVARSRAVFWLAVAGNIAVLAAFKYRDMLLPSTVTQDFARIAIPLASRSTCSTSWPT